MSANAHSIHTLHATASAERRPEPPRLLEHRVLVGCNPYHASTVLRQRVDLGELAGLSSAAPGAEFAARFAARFAALEQLPAARRITDDFIDRLSAADGVPLDEVLLEAILAVDQYVAFTMRRFGALDHAEIIRGGGARCVDYVWATRTPGMSRTAARVALAGVLELLPVSRGSCREDPQGGFEARLAKLCKRAQRRQWSMTTAVMALAAERRGLPCEALGTAYLRLGQGAAQRVLCASAVTRGRPAGGRPERRHRDLLCRLRSAGIAVPLKLHARNADEARAAAACVGFPLLVRLAGKGIRAARRARDGAELSAALDAALRFGDVTVEPYVRGARHRLLVIGGRYTAALRIEPPAISGDGRRTIAQLIDEQNGDPRRDGLCLRKVAVDDELETCLALRGRSRDDVLVVGDRLTLHHAADPDSGATHTDVTDDVHPDNRDLAERAARAAGLDVAGVDLVIDDVRASHRDAEACVVDLDPQPELGTHALPRHGASRDVGGAMLERMFPQGASAIVPIAVIAGVHGTTLVARDVAGLLRAVGRVAGLATRKHMAIDGRQIDAGSRCRRDPARFLLDDPRVEAVIAATSPHRIAERGLRIDRCTVAALVDLGGDFGTAAGQRAAEVLCRATSDCLVVNADSPIAETVLEHPASAGVLLVAPAGSKRLHRFLAAGGTAVHRVRRQGHDRIRLQRGDEVVCELPAPAVRARSRKQRHRRIMARMYAVALAAGLGLSSVLIQAACRRRDLQRR
jgi:cyanophycin synthetase